VASEVTRFGVDVGGTFTDIVALSPQGDVAVGKVRSTPGTVSATVWDEVTRLRGGESAAQALIHGTTVATNALLERSSGLVVLVATAGFEDLLWLRRQDRSHLYDLSRDHPPPLAAREDVVGVDERVGAEGMVRELADAEIGRVVAEVERRRPDAVAVALLFSFRDPTHERRLAAALRKALPDTPVAASCEVLPVFREYERTSTTTVEAYLRPKVSGYLARMGADATDRGIGELRIMASNGGTLSVAQAGERAAALALSGPAGGVEGARRVGAQLGMHDLLTLDMGGTSADASIVLGGWPMMQAAGAVGGVPLALPHVLIETVGAGGGSVALVDEGGALRVGPRSAGAMPGPACYGTGGTEATVTDAAAALGWLDAAHPLAGGLRLDVAKAEEAVGHVAEAAGLSLERCADGVIEVANAAMVRALRRVSVERGVDPRSMTLVAFGGAGPMFACRMADSLGMERALVPPHAGVLSALGLASAPDKLEFASSLHALAHELDAERTHIAFTELEDQARDALAGAQLQRLADCRYPGQGYELTVPVGASGDDTAAAFHDAHLERFGHADAARPVELVNLRVVASRRGTDVRLAERAGTAEAPRGDGRAPLDALGPGTVIDGPFMLDVIDCTIRIEPGWRGTVHATGAVVLERT
jgi:N-methylhydantoinase A